MITVIIGVVSFLLGLMALLFIPASPIIGNLFLILVSISALLGWGVIYFGGDWSWIQAKMNMNKSGKQGLLLIHRKDGRVKLHFFGANAKKLELNFSNGKDVQKYIVVINQPFATLVNSGQGIWYYRQGAMCTSFPDQNLEISDQSPQVADLLVQTLQFGRLSKPASSDYGLFTLIGIGVLLIGLLAVGFLIYGQGQTLTTISTQIGQLNTTFTSLTPPPINLPITGGGTLVAVNPIP